MYNPDNKKLARDILELLRQRLPAGWKLVLQSQPSLANSGIRPDFVFELTGPDGRRVLMIVEAKTRFEPKDVATLKNTLDTHARTLGAKTVPLVIAPFLSSSTRRRLAEANIPYADRTGNIRLVASRPGLYIETQGAEKNPARTDRPARSLKGAKAGRIVRALCDQQPPFGVRKLADSVDVNPGYVSRVLSLLESEDLVKREKRGPVTEVRWRDLIERWAQDYGFLDSNRVVAYLEPRDITVLFAKLASTEERMAITGSAAASIVAPIAPTRLVAAYVEYPEAVAKKLKLQPAETGANVLLAEPFDSVVFECLWKENGVPFAAWSQVAADLLTSPGRGPSEAQALLDWMQAHESEWRR